MAAVYGGMLNAFPELCRWYEAFKMEPHIGGGYGGRYDKRKINGYWSWRKHSQMGIEGDLRTPAHDATLWAKDDFLTGKPKIEQNDYIEVDGGIFVVIDDDNFSHEGGFTKCLVRRLAGPTDQQHTNTKVDEAVRNDY